MASGQSYRLRLDQGPAPGSEYELTEPAVKIGRDPEANTIVISAPGVSRQHAVLRRQAQGFVIEDLGSANGTFVNGQRLSGPHTLRAGDTIRLGQSVQFTYQAPATATVFEGAGIPPTVHQEEPPSVPQRTVPRPPPPPPPPPQPPAQPSAAQTAVGSAPPPRPAAPPPARPAAPPPARPAARQAAQPVAAAPYGPPGEAGATVFVAPSDVPSGEPPQLVIETAGEGKMTFRLTEPVYTFGRSEDNSIHVSSRIVSRHHARLERVDGGAYRIASLVDVGNPLLFQGRPLSEPRQLKHNDLLRIGGQDPGTMVTMTYVSPSMAAEAAPVQIDFGERTEIQIGRDPANEVRLDSPAVSRFHAVIQRVGQRFRVRDLRSVNGTFVNDVRVDGEVWLNPNDSIRIGSYRFVLGRDGLVQHDESGGVRVNVLGLNKWVRKDLNILQNIYLAVQPREFVVLVGLSGAGKSTLMDAIAGYRPATHGQVLVNGTDVYQHFDAIRNEIGFVPQRDIIHMELTTFKALDYAAQLRMPADTTRAERRQRIDEVLNDLDLAERRNVQVARLSGGQQKRVSIGVELLTKPGLFFLDEPTSGLDPGTETALMQLMRRLADQGRTIILITHATKNVMLADKVIFLVRGGYLAWFGPPNEALKYFDQFRTERERRAEDIEFDDIYNILQEPKLGSPKDWAERFQQHPAFQQYIVQPLQQQAQQVQAAPAAQPAAKVARRPRRQISSLRQFIILSMRNINILARDQFSLALMLLTPPLVGVLTTIVSQRKGFDAKEGEFSQAVTGIFLMVVFAIIVGIMSQHREIVKEQDIYRRERLVNLKIFPYVLSKVWVAGLLALVHAGIYIVVRYLWVDMPGGFLQFFELYITLVFATIAAMLLGLFASSLASNNAAAAFFATLFFAPQVLLGTALLSLPSLGPIGGALSTVVSSRWAFEATMTITGIGKDVAADKCWALSKPQREALTEAEKDKDCMCMGVNLFSGANFGRPCYFPGLQQFYSPAIDQPAPVRPAEPQSPGAPPTPPSIAAPPTLPPPNDPVAQQQFARDYQAWGDQFKAAQSSFEQQTLAYQAQLDQFRVASDAYQQAIEKYQHDVTVWQSGRSGAIIGGENLLSRLYDEFGHTYNVNIVGRWFIQVVISFVLFIAILIIQKRKDVV